MTSLGPDCPFLGEAGVAMGRVMTPGDQALCGGTVGTHVIRELPPAGDRRPGRARGEGGGAGDLLRRSRKPWAGRVLAVRVCVCCVCVCVVCNRYVYVELHSMSSAGVADVCVVCLVCVRWEVPGV